MTRLQHSTSDIPIPSPMAAVAERMQLAGYKPQDGEADQRPLPEEHEMEAAASEMFFGLASTLTDTLLEPDLEDLLWGLVNLFHRHSGKLQLQLHRNEENQKNSQKEQDGSEIRSVELERLIAQGSTLSDRMDGLETLRDHAETKYRMLTGSSWTPKAGSKINHAAMTASIIDSRDFLAAKRRREIEPLVPAGTRIAFAGGMDFQNYDAIWSALDKTRAKHPGMVLMHGGSPKGAELIAAKWADARKVQQIVFKPDWNKHAKAAPFKRNDAILATLPAGLVVFPGNGITDNLADKARAMRIPVWRVATGA